MAERTGPNFVVGPYRCAWDDEAKVYVVDCVLDVDDSRGTARGPSGHHYVATQGTTMAEARAAMDGAVDLTIKNWPPRKS